MNRHPDEDTVADTNTVASSVGSTWRGIKDSKKKPKSSNHPSRVPPPVGKKLGLLLGLDDESGCASNSCKTIETMLQKYGYVFETVIDSGENEAQFEVDVEAGLNEIIALVHPGDSIFVYGINFGSRGRHNASSILHRLAQNLPADVRATCLFDCCYLSAKPAYRMDHRQEKIYTAKSAGLKHQRRLAQPLGQPQQPVPSDIFVFSGENPTGKTLAFRTTSGMHGIYTAAWARAYEDRNNRGIMGEPPTYSQLSIGIEDELRSISFGKQPHSTTSEILCAKPYDIDQRCYI